MVKALQNSFSVVVSASTKLKAMANTFYQNRYSSEGVHNMGAVLEHVLQKVTEEMNTNLCAPYTNEEVKIALFQMLCTKALGPDGFPAHFYQRHCDICGEEVSKNSVDDSLWRRKPGVDK